MGEHKHGGPVKGDAYKRAQRQPLPARWAKVANVKPKWLRNHGFKQNEEGKWVRS